MSVPVVDDSQYPIVSIDFGRELTLADVAAHRENFERMVRGRGPVVCISTLTQMDFRASGAEARRQLAADADVLARAGTFLAEYVVADSPVLRALYTAYQWLRRSTPHPVQTFATKDAALIRAKALLAEKRIAGF